MKKFFSLFLVIIICFSLCSCGGGTSDTQTDTGVHQREDSAVVSRLKDKMQSADNCTAAIRLQINPVFDIYLDNDNNVISANAVNSDAQQVLSHTDITGRNCVDAICELINIAIVTGMVKDDISVIVIPASNGDNPQTEEMIKDIPEAVSGVYHNFSVTAIISDKMAEVQFTDTDGTSKVMDDETSNPDAEIIKDEKGNIIRSEQIDDAGNMITYFYDENGRLIRHIKENADDTTTTTTLDGNGNPMYQTGTTVDGGISEHTYHPNGEVKTATITYSDGVYNRQIFDEKGIKLFYEGAYVRDDGVLTDFRFRYDASGRETEYWGQDNVGRPVHRINNPDGTSVTYRTEDDGSVTTINYDANGNILQS